MYGELEKIMNSSRVLKLILPHTAFMKELKAGHATDIVQAIKNSKLAHCGVEESKMFRMIQPKQSTRFEQFFKQNYTPVEDMHWGIDEQKWSLLEQLCSRKGIKVKDIGSIARYDTETVKFLSELPDEKLLKLQDFIRMKKLHFESFQEVAPDTLKVLSEMTQPQLDFVKKYLQIENRGLQVFNDKQIIALARHGCNEKQINRLIFDGGLYGESIMEATSVKDLNIDKLIQEINKAKKAYGKNFKSAHVVHNDYNPHSFSLGIIDHNGNAYLKTFDKDFNIFSEEQLFIESIKNGQMSISRAGTQNIARREELQALLDDENAIVTLKRLSKKGNLQSDVTLKANWTESRKLPTQAILNKSQVVSEEISFIGKNGEQLVETMVPSEVEGIYRIVQKAPDGAVKVLGDAKIDPKTGIKTITKNMESLNGTTTDKVMTIQPNGNMSLSYIVKDAEGNVLMNRQLIHTFVSPAEAISKVNGNTYRITYSTDKISVLNSQNGKVTDINLTEILKDCTPEQKQEMMAVLKQMSGENLLHINDKVRNFEVIDDLLASYACYAGQDVGIIATGGNQFATTHELYHLISRAENVRNADKIFNCPKFVRNRISDTYQKELKLFLEHFPEAQRNHVNYFTNQLAPITSIEETIAEAGAALNTYNNMSLFSIRTEYLERYFPETIAQIEKATAYTEPHVLSESKKIFSGTVSLDEILKKMPDLSKTKLGLPNQNKMLCIA